MRSAAAIGIHNDFTPGKAGITHRSAHYEPTGGIHIELGRFINISSRNDGFDNGLCHRLPQLFQIYLRVMLRRDDNGGTTKDLAGLVILHRHLALSIGTKPCQFSALSYRGQPA